MFDIQWLRANLSEFCSVLETRGFSFDRSEFERLDEIRKKVQSETQEHQSYRNRLSKEIASALRQNQPVDELKRKVVEQSDHLLACEQDLEKVLHEMSQLLLHVPNLPQDSVPLGHDEQDNVELRQWGTPPVFDFPALDHMQLANKRINFDQAHVLSGSRFSVLHQLMAALHRALIQFMMDVHVRDHGYQEVSVPYIVHERCLYGTGQLPKFSEDLFEVRHKDNERFYLIPTAEVPVTNLYRDQILSDTDFPIKHVCHTPCFRSEAGSYGRDNYGLFRQHQFEKVELVRIVHPDQSQTAHEEMTEEAEKILKLLNLPYRVMNLSRGDLGFSSSKTYDLEVWLPSQGKYREISSSSNFLSFQSRRMNCRFRGHQDKKSTFPHTLNASGLAIGRTLIAVLENNQDKNGNVRIPEVLHFYLERSGYVL